MKKVLEKIRNSKIGKATGFCRDKIRTFNAKYFSNPILQTAVIAFFLELVIESFGHKSVTGGIVFLATSPLVFLLNALIIFVTLSVAWFFKRRIFVNCIISVIWLAVGIANGVILQFRMTPFTINDLSFLEMGIAILPNYFTTNQMILLGAALVLLIGIFVLLFIFAPKANRIFSLKRTLVSIVVSVTVLIGSMAVSMQTGVVATYFGNLWDAYYDYGVPYCFMNTWLNKGISKPSDYSQEMVNNILSQNDLNTMTTKKDSKKSDDDYPNIIFLQLESFIDPDEVKGMKYSEEVVPYFKKLKKEYSSGHLTVPSVGGGTANTEFEVMTGMSVRFFGPGEYPYKSILQEETCESMAYNLKGMGYATHAMHNHRGAFYDRNKIFANLGYDTYTSMEYMSYITKTPRNWARDDVLIDEITGALESTENKDYIYAISVQGHGEYPRQKVFDDPEITVENEDIDNGLKNAYEYYIQEIREMDNFLRQLTSILEKEDEETVLVLYGDHLPALDMEDDDMKSGSTYDTEYVIWSNFDMEKKDKDLDAYQLSAEIQKRIGMREGTLTVFHQDNKGKQDYLKDLETLQYDMLYGKKYIYKGESPYKTTDLSMGYKPIKINEIVEIGGNYFISGEGFTPYSKVSLDDKVLETQYMDSTILKLLEEVDPADVGKLKVSQVEKNKEILSTSE